MRKESENEISDRFRIDAAYVDTSLDDINQTDLYGRTTLFNAAQQGDAYLVKQLLDNGADPNIPDNELTYPIHEIIDNGYLDILYLLIDYGKC